MEKDGLMPKYRSKANGTIVEADRFRPGDKEQAGRLGFTSMPCGRGCNYWLIDFGDEMPVIVDDGDWILSDETISLIRNPRRFAAEFDPVEEQ